MSISGLARSIIFSADGVLTAEECSPGIEGYCAERLVDHALLRWAPLTVPAGVLYFLPRPGCPAHRRLRLVSSAAWPPELYQASAPDQVPGHYQALPLGDGQHILFVDAVTKALCLGSDVPGFAASSMLRRKILFVGPAKECPSVFASGRDADGGVTAVAGYGCRVFLFCVPADVHAALCSGQDDRGLPESLCEGGAPSTGDAHSGFRCRKNASPLAVHGTEIGQVEGLVKLSIRHGQQRDVWAFTMDGTAHIWRIDHSSSYEGLPVQEKPVFWNGTTVDAKDADGDVLMTDVESAVAETGTPVPVTGILPDMQDRPEKCGPPARAADGKMGMDVDDRYYLSSSEFEEDF